MNVSSALEMALLGLIAQKPQSGYDLRKTFATTAMRHYSDSPGSIYPALRRIEAQGWIESIDQGAESPGHSRRRREFRLTDGGRAVLKTWLAMPVKPEDMKMRQAELMLRFAFMDGNVPRSVTLTFLDQFTRELAGYAAELRIQWEQMTALMDQAIGRDRTHTGLLAFQSGIEGLETQLAWARRARAQLAEDVP